MTIQEQQQRLLLDYRVMRQMKSEIIRFSAFRSVDDLYAGSRAIVDDSQAIHATHYRVDYLINTLVGPGKIHGRTAIHFDLCANGSYPYSDPTCWVIGEPVPWSPHFKKGVPVCIGSFWKDAGGPQHILLAHLVIHVARLLNFDEIGHGGGYVGWNPAAIAYWKTAMKSRPVTPGLAYPALPSEITHGLAATSGGSLFKPKAQTGSTVVPTNVFVAKRRI